MEPVIFINVTELKSGKPVLMNAHCIQSVLSGELIGQYMILCTNGTRLACREDHNEIRDRVNKATAEAYRMLNRPALKVLE